MYGKLEYGLAYWAVSYKAHPNFPIKTFGSWGEADYWIRSQEKPQDYCVVRNVP